MKKILGAAILAVLSPLACSAELRDAKSVLQQIEGAVAQAAKTSDSAQLLADLQQFRVQYRQLAPRAAAERWFALLDRAQALPMGMGGADASSIDLENRGYVGIGSVLASIPAPAAWPEMRSIAAARAKKAGPGDLNALAIQLLTDGLNNDGAALKATLAKVDSATRQLAPEMRANMTDAVLNANVSIAASYGTPDDVVTAFETKLKALDGGDAQGTLQIPDLVGMVGAERATPLLRKAVTSSSPIYVVSGVETRRLARQLALADIAHMNAPQWALVDTIEATALYEAIQEKFGDESHDSTGGDDADIYYLLSTIIAKQQQKAEAVLARIARSGQLYLPPSAVKALRDAGQGEALAEFLHASLAKQPELEAWDVYIEQAAYAGRSKQALELIRQLQQRADLPAHLRKELAAREIEALLANNQIDAGIKSLRAQIAAKPGDDKVAINRQIANATRLARIGRLLERRDIVREGIDAARASLPRADGPSDYMRDIHVTQLYEVYRRVGDAAGAQDLALAELARASSGMEQAEQFGMGTANSGKRKALIELVGIYTTANRPQDALAVLREAKQWGARDLGEFIDEKDSLGMPIGYAAARSLAETGERDNALRVLRALIQRSPGYDAGYELLVKLTGSQSNAELDALYLRDQFEERPLIWKAQTLLQTQQLQAAEETIRRAIAIDPSDGEQPANDRLRAYAVLADIVDAKGQQKDAAGYRQALEANDSAALDRLWREGKAVRDVL